VAFWKSIDARLVTLFGRLVDALCDPIRRHRVALIASLTYAVMWAIYAIIAKSSQGINADLGEMVVWSRNLDWGFPKHPPFPALVLAGWFAIFPLADWAYYLLSGLTLGIGLYFSFLLAGLWLDDKKLAVAPFLLTLIPFYNFLGLKFDQNSILIPLWALTTWAFVLSFRRRHLGYAALAAVAAASAVLTKYWSVFLVLALVIAALSDPRRRIYFRSVAPWVTLLVGSALIAPHLIWLVRENFPPLQWVTVRRDAGSVAAALGLAVAYLAYTLAYVSSPLILFLWRVPASAAAWRDTILPREPQRRTAALVFWLPLLLPTVVAAATRTALISLWSTPSMGLLPVVLMSSPLVVVGRIAAVRIVGFAVSVSILALLVSPIVAAAKLVSGVENDASYVTAAVAALEREWNSQTDRPLEILAGPFGLASSAAFTLKDKPSTFADFSPYLSPWVGADALMHKGLAVICPRRDAGCMNSLEHLTKQRPAARQVDIELTPRWLGFSGKPDSFVIAILPPR
jgi:hypothetical protein